MYVVKDHDERRQEFLDTAMQLFMQNGYERTTVNAIIDAVGVSKGAFYHYFKTKEQLLTELSKRASHLALEAARPIVDDPGTNALAKMNAIYRSTNSFKAQNRDLIMAMAEAFSSDANLRLRERMSAASVEAVAPLIARIIEQGNREKTMSVRDPEPTARFVLRIGSDLVGEFASSLRGLDGEAAVTQVTRTLEMYTESVERILGVEPGSLVLIDDDLIGLIRGGTP